MKAKLGRLNNRLVKDTFLYTLTDALGKALSFILLPFVSFYLPPDGLGMATNFSVLSSIVSLSAGAAIINTLPYFFYEQSKEETRKMVSNIFLFSLFICILLFFLIVCFHSVIHRYLQLDVKFQVIAVLYVLLSIFENMNMQLYRLEEKPKTFALYKTGQIVLQCLLTILFIIVLKWGGEGKIGADSSCMFAMGTIHCILIHKRGYFSLKYNVTVMRKVLSFGLPLMPHSISFWMKGGADKVFLTTFCGLFYNGIYSMALSLSSIYSLLSNAFFNAYTPYLHKKLAAITPQNEQLEKIKIVKGIYLLLGMFFLLSLLAIACSWILVHYIVNERYIPSFQLVPGIIFSLFIHAFYSFTIQFIYKQKKTKILGLITFSGSFIQMVLSYFFVKNIGYIGVVYSSIIGSMIVSFFISYYSYRIYKMPWFFFLHKIP